MKNKILIRALSLMLVFIVAVSAVSCSEKSTENKPSVTVENVTETEEETTAAPSQYELLETVDYEGAIFNILLADPSNGLATNIPGEEMNGEAVNDGLIERDYKIESRYNVDVTYYEQGNGDVSTIKRAVLANDQICNMAIGTLMEISKLATENVLYNLIKMPNMTIDKNWWSPLMTEATTLKGASYVTAGDIATGIYQAPCCMFLNLKLYDDYNINTDIYQLVLDGKWTLDELALLTKDMDIDINGNGKNDITDDIYGIGMQPTSETTQAFLAGAGEALCNLTPDGNNIVFDSLYNDRTISVVEKIIKVARNIPYSDINDVIKITFKSDRALFLQHKLETAAVHLRDMESDYLILPDPKGTEDQEHYVSFVSGWVTGFICIPLIVEPEFTGLITEALARYSNEKLRPLAYDMFYKEKTTRDPRSADVLDILFDNLYIDINSIYNFGGVNDALTTVVFNEKPYASTLEAKATSIESAIKKTVDNWVAE